MLACKRTRRRRNPTQELQSATKKTAFQTGRKLWIVLQSYEARTTDRRRSDCGRNVEDGRSGVAEYERLFSKSVFVSYDHERPHGATPKCKGQQAGLQ